MPPSGAAGDAPLARNDPGVLAKNESTRLLTGHAATTDLEVVAATNMPCSICWRWFEPHPRAGSRQRVCSSEEYEPERQRRAMAA